MFPLKKDHAGTKRKKDGKTAQGMYGFQPPLDQSQDMVEGIGMSKALEVDIQMFIPEVRLEEEKLRFRNCRLFTCTKEANVGNH